MSNKIAASAVGIVALGLVAALASKATPPASGSTPPASGSTPPDISSPWTPSSSEQLAEMTGIDVLRIELARLQFNVALATQNMINETNPAVKVKLMAILANEQRKLAEFLAAHPELTGQSNTTTTAYSATPTSTNTVETPVITTPYTTQSGQTFEITYHGVQRTATGYKVYMEGRLITVCDIYPDRVEVDHPSGWLTANHETWYKDGHGSYHTEQYYYHVSYRDREAR